MKNRIRQIWRHHSFAISQWGLWAAIVLNAVSAVLATSSWGQSLGWGCVGFCLGTFAMNHVTHYFVARCRELQDMMEAIKEVHVDEVGAAIAANIVKEMSGIAEVKIEHGRIVRH